MLKLEWELKDPKSCEGCDFFSGDLGDYSCKLHFRYGVGGDKIQEYFSDKRRPKVCIDELGE